jgi:hypothetical protein
MYFAFILLFAVTFVLIVTLSFMTPMDRRVFMGFVYDAWDRAIDEVIFFFRRVKRWWDERQAKKAAQKSYGGS